jgi:hypothetical protein
MTELQWESKSETVISSPKGSLFAAAGGFQEELPLGKGIGLPKD